MTKRKSDWQLAFEHLARSLEETHGSSWIGLREEVRLVLDSLLEGNCDYTLSGYVGQYIAARLIPIMEAEDAAEKGRPGAPGAGEMVQAFIDFGSPRAKARAEVARRLGMKPGSAGAAHRKYLKTRDPNRPALLYSEPIVKRDKG